MARRFAWFCVIAALSLSAGASDAVPSRDPIRRALLAAFSAAAAPPVNLATAARAGAAAHAGTAPDSIAPSRRRSVQPPNLPPPPQAAADAYSVAQGQSLPVPAPGVLANDTPNIGSITSYGAVTGTEQKKIGQSAGTSQGGTVLLNLDGSFVYDPPAAFSGTDTFVYFLTNADGSVSATVTITVTAAPPAPSPDSYSTANGTTLTVTAPGILANDTLNGGALVSYGVAGSEQTSLGATTPTLQGGSVSVSADGALTFVPAGGFAGADSFHYVLRNGGGSATALVTIAVQPPAGPDFVVSTPGFFYSFDKVAGENPPLTLTRGRTYTFKIDVASIHPFEILGAPAGSVTNNNITSGTLTFRVPDTPGNYAYQCSIHFFGNTITAVP